MNVMKAQPNPGTTVTWAPSKSGRIQIALGFTGGQWKVWGLYTGTHDLTPISRNFHLSEAAARVYANQVWARS
jgi:hypothetical protein